MIGFQQSATGLALSIGTDNGGSKWAENIFKQNKMAERLTAILAFADATIFPRSMTFLPTTFQQTKMSAASPRQVADQ